MSTRAAPGPQLSSGRLRVDAARAIAKLREYQLVDRTAWVLEAIRAGVASGATTLRLAGDANDVWLVWEGAAWPAEDLPKLFDELVSPEPTEERHHLRLLAAAVNSGLGSGPAYIDIYAVTPDGTVRTRYTPDVLVETAELEDSPLRRLVAEPAAAPAELAPQTGMLVHLRRRTALGMLTYLFWEREPPELATARAACRDLAVPITIGRDTYCRTQLGHDLMRLAFDGDLAGFVAIRDPDAPRVGFPDATLEIAEHGVLLATYPIGIAPTGGEIAGRELQGPLPIRVFVDAKRMPTNASRSQVRREVPPISTADRRGPELAKKLIADLVREVGEPGCDERKRRAACALVAAAIGGPEWSTECFALQVAPFSKLELFRDAAGIRRPLRHAWSGHIYTGKDHLDPVLGPWVSSIAWIPRGDPAGRIVAGSLIDSRDTKSRIAWAKKQYKAHKKFFAHKAQAAALVVKRQPRVRLTLGAKLPGSVVPPSRFDKMTGEIAVSFERGEGELLLLFQGRPIERITMPSPIGFDAVVDSVELTPGDKFNTVERDAYYRCVELAIQAALLCATEVIAAQLENPDVALPDGITTGRPSNREVEARAVRIGLGIAHDLQLPRSAMLARAKAWQRLDREWIDFNDVVRHSVIGFTSGVHRFTPPANRLILLGNQAQVVKLLPSARLVDYDKGWRTGESREDRPYRLAGTLAATHGFALAVLEDDVCGAIAPSSKGVIQLHHVGHTLDTRERIGRLGPTALVVDSDAIIPDVDWKAAGDTGGVHERDYRAWEVALVRAALRALAGDRVIELHGPEVLRFDSQLVRWTLTVLGKRHQPPPVDPALDATLLAQVRKAQFIHVLGERDLVSIETLVARFPTTIYYVAQVAAPVTGFAPIVATAEVAEGIGMLAGVPVADGAQELEIKRKARLREGKLVIHRAQPERAFVYPFQGEPHIEIAPKSTTVNLKGLVGVGRNRLEIDVRIEGRTFATLTRQAELPLYAVIELDIAHANDQFSGLSDLVSSQLIEIVRRLAGAVLMKIANTRPHLLGDAGAPRTLLSAALGTPAIMSPMSLDAIRDAPAFITIQGTRVSIADAIQPHGVLRVASWQNDWLDKGDGPVDSLDANIIRIPETKGELEHVLRNLHGKIGDVTDEVIKLQSRRRMARGLLPVPTLPHVPAELKRKLSELGDLGKRWGHGEIGLVVAEGSSALIHDHGVLRQRVTLDVFPNVQLAIEAPELLDDDAEPQRVVDTTGSIADQHSRLRDLQRRDARTGPAALTKDAQELAAKLLEVILAGGRGEGLAASIKSSIRRALLMKRIAPGAVPLPLFELADGSWAGFEVFEGQIVRHGNAWAVTSPTSREPLDDSRLVFVLGKEELDVAQRSYPVIDAANELELDDRARKNKERSKAASLDLRGREYVLAQTELDGDGVRQPRGVVGALMPHAVDQRGLWPHMEMMAFQLMRDPCKWPTIAMIDDARLEPDRTWEKPLTHTPAWAEIMVRVSSASERALSMLVPRVDGALAHLHVGQSTQLGARATNNKLQVRGSVWLNAAPRPPVASIEVFDAYGRHAYVPEHAFGMAGRLYVYAPEGWDRERTLHDMIPKLYGLLMRQLLGRKNQSDLILAHLATALALELITPKDAGTSTFPCFRPSPLDAAQLAELFGSSAPVRVIPIAELELELDDPEGVVADGSALSEAVITQLSERAKRGPIAKPAKPKPEKAPRPTWRDDLDSVVRTSGLEANTRLDVPPPKTREPQPAPPKPKPEDPIQNVVDGLMRRLLDLQVPAFAAEPADFASPLMVFEGGTLRLASGHRRLHAVANAIRANSPWAPLAVDALAAHAITVLDEARSEVNTQTVRDVLAALLRD